jgi:hypothetical protein
MKVTYPAINCFIPDFEWEQRLSDYKPRRREKYIFAMHSILFQSLRNKKKFSGFVNLDSRLLVKMLGSNFYKVILKELIDAKIIEQPENNVYSAGAFSKSYRINPSILKETRLKSIPITKQTYCRKIAFARDRMIKDAIDINPLLQHEFLMLTHRTIDRERAEYYIRQKYDVNSEQFKSRLIAIREFDAMQYAKIENGVYKINFHFSYKGGRVYSPASMLPRDLEQFTDWHKTIYKDERSVSIDMPNSQLCFFHHLVNSKVEHIGKDIEESIEGVEKRPFGPKQHSTQPHTYNPPYVFYFKTWADYIFNGQGYERMMYLTSWKGKKSDWTKDERQEFKGEFFGQLFYNKYRDALTDMEMAFMANHEPEAKALRSIKQNLGNSLLAVQVQQLEGKFFHHIVVGYLKENYKDVPFTIKHDSITLPKSCASFLIEEINVLVRRFFGRNDIELKAELL